MSDTAEFTVTRDEGASIAVFTITRPARANALSHAVLDGLIGTLRALPEHCRGVLLDSDGPVFSAGADLGCVKGNCADARPVQDLIDELVDTIESAPFPVAAFLDGKVVGAAVEVVSSCDIRLATPRAVLRIPATEIGTIYRPAGLENLSRRLPFVALQSMLLLGNTVSAGLAESWGLVEQVPDRTAAVAALTGKLTRLSQRPGSFAAQKASLTAVAHAIRLPEETRQIIAEIRNEFAGPAGPLVRLSSL